MLKKLSGGIKNKLLNLIIKLIILKKRNILFKKNEYNVIFTFNNYKKG